MVTWSYQGSNATGPDGFNFNLYKKAWPLIGDEMFLLVLEFFKESKMPKDINNACITLILKVKGANKFTDFRPISLVNEI